MKRQIIIGIISILVITLGIYTLFFKQAQTVTTSKVGNPYKILVDVEESKLYVLENNVCTKVYTCAGGKYSTPSPIGTWTITNKAKWGEGFGGSWLRI